LVANHRSGAIVGGHWITTQIPVAISYQESITTLIIISSK